MFSHFIGVALTPFAGDFTLPCQIRFAVGAFTLGLVPFLRILAMIFLAPFVMFPVVFPLSGENLFALGAFYVTALCLAVHFQLFGRATTEGTAATAPGPIRPFRERVSVLAMGSPSVLGGGASAAERVGLRGNQFYMNGIYAPSVIANYVVKLVNLAPSFGARERLDRPRIKDAVDQFTPTAKRDLGVSPGVERANPLPTSGFGVDFYLREDAGDVFDGKMFDDKVFLFRHGSASYAGLC